MAGTLCLVLMVEGIPLAMFKVQGGWENNSQARC